MRRRRASLGVSAGAAVLVLTAVLLFAASLRDPGYVRLAAAPATDRMQRSATTFVVDAAPFSQVELLINGRRVTSAYVPGNAHRVRFEDTPLVAGRNEILARATLWYAAVRRVHDATTVVDRAASPASAQRRADPSRQQRDDARGTRTLALDVHFQEAAASFTVRLPRNDPAVIALLGRRMETTAFVDNVFGQPELNHARLSRFFSGVEARIRTSSDGVTVSAASGFRRPGLEQLPAFAGALEVGNDDTAPRVRVSGAVNARGGSDGSRRSRAWDSDTLRLAVADYRVDDPLPLPFVRDGAAYVWEGPFRDGQRPVAMDLTYTPLASITALRRGLNLSVFAFVHPIVARFLAFGHGFLLAIPMFAYLVLSQRRAPRLTSIARRLIVVAVAADVFNACISSQPDVNVEVPLIAPVLRGLTAPVLTQLIVPAVIGLVLAAIAASVAHLVERSDSPAGVVVFEAARAVCVAAAAYAVVVIVGFVAATFAQMPLLYSVLVGVLLGTVLIGLLRAAGWWTIVDGRRRAAFTAATVAGALVLTIPFSLVHYGAWAANPALTATGFASATSPLALTTEFLRILGVLAPYAFGLVLLRAIRTDDVAIDAERFARIAFCCYAADTSGVVVLLPVSFMLAWATFARLRRAAQPEARAAAAFDVLASAPERFPRVNGRSAIPLALVFAAAEVALFMWFAAPHLGELHTPFVVLEAVVFVTVAVASFVVPAVAFSVWCARDGGERAMRRAVITGGWVVACSLPAWFLRLETAGSLVAMTAVTAAFYISLGFFFRAPAVRRVDAREAGAS